MIIVPLTLLFFAYQLGWYGYATLQQPVSGGCVGFTDLLLPGQIGKVNGCIQNGWGASGGNASGDNTTSPSPANNTTAGPPTTPSGSATGRPNSVPPSGLGNRIGTPIK